MGIRRSDEKLSAAQRENNVVLIEDNYRQHYAGYDPRSPESMLIFQVMNEKNMAASVELAQLIQKYTCSTARRINKGVKQDAFLVLRPPVWWSWAISRRLPKKRFLRARRMPTAWDSASIRLSLPLRINIRAKDMQLCRRLSSLLKQRSPQWRSLRWPKSLHT